MYCMVSAFTDPRENGWSDIWQEIHSLCGMHEISRLNTVIEETKAAVYYTLSESV